MQARVLVLHFLGSTQRLKVFPTTPRDELLAGIRELLGVVPGSPLRFRDGDGDVVLITAGMPSGVELHVAVEEGFPIAVKKNGPPAAPSAGPFRRWDKCVGGAISNGGHDFQHSDEGGALAWSAYSPPLPLTGHHYFVIDFSNQRPCCAAIGVIPATLSSIPPATFAITDMAFPHMVALKGVGRGPTGAQDRFTGSRGGMAVGVYIDVDARMVVLVDHANPQDPAGAIRLDDVPVPMVFAICGPKHGVAAKFLPVADTPAGGVFTGVSASYRKQPATGSSQP